MGQQNQEEGPLPLPQKETESAISEDFQAVELY